MSGSISDYLPPTTIVSTVLRTDQFIMKVIDVTGLAVNTTAQNITVTQELPITVTLTATSTMSISLE